jgi:hypothetical protein
MTRGALPLAPDLARDIDRARAELAMLRERRAVQEAVLEDCRLRGLIAETPQADRDAYLAANDLARIDRRLHEVERTLSELLAEAHARQPEA